MSTFSGVTRNHHGGQSVTLLRYEAYHEMALRQLQAICSDARSRWPLHSIAVAHRTGIVAVREVGWSVGLLLLLLLLLWLWLLLRWYLCWPWLVDFVCCACTFLTRVSTRALCVRVLSVCLFRLLCACSFILMVLVPGARVGLTALFFACRLK